MSYEDGKEIERLEGQKRIRTALRVFQQDFENVVTREVNAHNSTLPEREWLKVRGNPAVHSHLSITNDETGINIKTALDADGLTIDESDGTNWKQLVSFDGSELVFVNTDAKSLAQSFIRGLVEDMQAK